MVITILMYSLFTCLTAFSQTWWHVVLLRFLVALGVGGEWAVASANGRRSVSSAGPSLVRRDLSRVQHFWNLSGRRSWCVYCE